MLLNKKMIMQTLVCAVTLATLISCAKSPLGRHQLLLMPDSQMNEMGVSAYQQIKSEEKVTTSSQQNTYVNCVANAITAVLDTPSHWEVNVFINDSANAFALPGGKIGVNVGLLNVAQNADQLAAVVGHEVGHVLAKHSNERMSIQTATQTSMAMLQALAGDPTPEKQQLFGLLGLGSQVGIALPFSRKHEAEADIIGLELMAKAGFNPQESVRLWQNMAAANSGEPPEFLSTHPANNIRIEGLQHHMDKAMASYHQARAAGRQPSCR